MLSNKFTNMKKNKLLIRLLFLIIVILVLIFALFNMGLNSVKAEECNSPNIVLGFCVFQDAGAGSVSINGATVDATWDFTDRNACFVGAKAAVPDCTAGAITNVCGDGKCPPAGGGFDGYNCHIDADNDSTGGSCSVNGSIPAFGSWDASQQACITCNANKTENKRLGWGTGNFYCNGDINGAERGDCESACGASTECDEQSEGYSTVAGKCQVSVANTADGCVWVAAAVCNNDGTCDAPGETTANCPNDCCTKTACGAGCTNAADCMTIEPDCAGACIAPACVTDTDCGYWVCDSGAGYIAEDCDAGAFLVCGGLDGTNCGGGKVWSCSGSCNPSCDPNWFPGGCFGLPPTPDCVDEYDACDCSCVAAAICNNNSVQDNGETGIDCGGGGCPACAACTPNGCGGGCPAGCTGADDPDCAGACLDPTCASDSDCCTNTPCAAPQVCDATSGACVDCLTSADCAADEVCDSGSCIPCSGEGVAETDPLLCCSGLNIIDGVCTSACDPNASFFCNPLRQSVETLVEGGEKMIGYILGLIGSVALLLVIIAGIMYMTSAGSEEKIASSKKILTGAVIGLGIALLAFSLLQVVLSVLNM